MENTITKEYIDGLIEDSEIKVHTVFDKVTVVALQLPNGFVIVESAGVVDKENYDEDMGKKIALERIENKLWELEGYMLQAQMAAEEEMMRLFDERMDNNDSEEKKEDEDIGDTLVVWLKNGKTLYFNGVRELWETSDKLAFAYYGMKTQVRREANFKLDSIAGYAVEED